MPQHFSKAPRVLAADTRDPQAWRRGREHYVAWIVDADLAPIRARITALQDALGDLWLPQQRQPHVTLFACGFVVDVMQHDDDIDAATLAAQREMLETCALAPFELTVGGIDSFDSAAFLRIDDRSGNLARLRVALQLVSREIRSAPYVPHLTLGLYRKAWTKRELAARYAAFSDLQPLTLPVRGVRLVRYAAAEIGGALTVIDDVVLHAPLPSPV